MDSTSSTTSESYVVSFNTPEGTASGTFSLAAAPDGQCHLSLSLADLHVSSVASDYFEALSTIRRTLETRRIFPICYGASRNCFPSGMARDMGAGLRVYKLYPGQKGRLSDLAALFDSGPDVVPSTVDEQRA